MSETENKVGYGNPPVEHQFKKGVCPNRKGRPPTPELALGDLVDRALQSETRYQEQGKLRRATRLRLNVMQHIARALKGDISSADAILSMRNHALKYGNSDGIIRIHINGGMSQRKR